MKKFFATFLMLAFGNLNAVMAADYYDYLFSENDNIAVNTSSNVVVIPEGYDKIGKMNSVQTDDDVCDFVFKEPVGIENIEDTEECYRGRVKYASASVPTTTQTSSSDSVKTKIPEKKSGTFSENHPIIAGLGIGILIAGMVVGAIMLDTDDEDEDEYDYCRHHHKHHGHRHSHSNQVCKN